MLLNTLQWRHDGRDCVSNHQPNDCLLNRLSRRRSTKTSKLHVTGLCAGNSPETGEFLAQMARNAENVSTWWRHHEHWYKLDVYPNASDEPTLMDMFECLVRIHKKHTIIDNTTKLDRICAYIMEHTADSMVLLASTSYI